MVNEIILPKIEMHKLNFCRNTIQTWPNIGLARAYQECWNLSIIQDLKQNMFDCTGNNKNNGRPPPPPPQQQQQQPTANNNNNSQQQQPQQQGQRNSNANATATETAAATTTPPSNKKGQTIINKPHYKLRTLQWWHHLTTYINYNITNTFWRRSEENHHHHQHHRHHDVGNCLTFRFKDSDRFLKVTVLTMGRWWRTHAMIETPPKKNIADPDTYRRSLS